MVSSGSGSDAVELDTTLYIPDSATSSTPAPAIIVAHGFGGSKKSVGGVAARLADEGYIALAYSARGFGGSTGTISINAPDFEIADASAMIDLLADRSEVLQDSAGDPRVGIYGRSYGGALTLLTAGYDDRVDAIAPGSTWNSLVSALFPNNVGAPPAETPAADPPPADDGVFKRLWANTFFESGGGTVPAPGEPASSGDCGRFRPDFCSAFLQSAVTGQLTPELKSLLDASSPASVLDKITAPTFLTQGEGDSLFPLSEADANARGIAANGTPVKIIWYSGGHGAQQAEGENRLQLRELGAWFDYYLRDQGSEPDATFHFSVLQGAATGNQDQQASIQEADQYPGLTGGAIGRIDIPLTGDTQQVLNPADGVPAALSALPPGIEVDQGQQRNSQVPTDIPDQTATFDSAVFESDMLFVGAPVVSVRVASPGGSAVLFGKLYDVDPDGQATLLRDLVAPVRLTGLATTIDQAQPIPITLAAIAQTIPAGHVLRVGLASTDQVYTTPTEQQVYDVALADASLSAPQVTATPSTPGGGANSGLRIFIIVGVALVVLVVVITIYVLVRGRRRTSTRAGY